MINSYLLPLDRNKLPADTESRLVLKDLVGDFIVHDVAKVFAGRAPKSVHKLADVRFQRLDEPLCEKVWHPFHFRVLSYNPVST